MITVYTGFLLFALAANITLGTAVYLTNSRRSVNLIFAILSATIAAWVTCQLLGALVCTEMRLAFWIRQSCAVSAFMPLVFSLLCDAAYQPHLPLMRLLRRSWVWIAIAVMVATMCQTTFFLRGAQLPTVPDQIGEPVYGAGFYIFVIYWAITVGWLVIHFIRSLVSSDGFRRIELQFMTLGSIMGLIPGVALCLLIPLLSGSAQSARIAPISVVLWHSIIAYGIATRRIMNITEFLGRMLAHLLLIALLVLVYFFIYHLTVSALWMPFDNNLALPHITATIVMALCLTPMRNFLQVRAGRLFSDRQDRLASLIHQVGVLAQSVTTIDSLLGRFAQLLVEALEIEHLGIYLRDERHFLLRQQVGASPGQASWDDESPLATLLRFADHPLSRDMLRRFGHTPADVHAEHVLAEAGAEAAIALHDKTGLIGFILLGRFSGGRTYGARETEVLAVLGNQLFIAFENARLYTSLQDAKRYNEALLEHLVTGVLAVDLRGCLTVCNREAQRILNLSADAGIFGKPIEEIVPAPIAAAMRAPLSGVATTHQTEVLLRDIHDEERTVRFAAAGFADHEGKPSGTLLVLQDVSALRRLEALVRRNDRLASLGTVAAGMAHEIKNPLVCLKTFAQLLPERYEDQEFRGTFATLVVQEVARIDTLISQLLNLARPVKPVLVPTSIHESLHEALQLIHQQLLAKGLTLTQDFAAAHDHIRGDARLLTQVFINLLLNAVDAMSAGGTLTVATAGVKRPIIAWSEQPMSGDWIEVLVRDTGHGIPAADLTRIFDPFFTTKPHGTGLGLSVAHGIVCDHQGLIDVESEPGAGTCFRVCLPLLPRNEK